MLVLHIVTFVERLCQALHHMACLVKVGCCRRYYYSNDTKYGDNVAPANIVDPDQTAPFGAV